MIDEQHLRTAFRSHVDRQAHQILSEAGEPAASERAAVDILRATSPRRTAPWLVAAAAAAVLVLGGAAVTLWSGQDKTQTVPAAPTSPSVLNDTVQVATTRGVITMEALSSGKLQIIEGCLAVGPETLLVVDDNWTWDPRTARLTFEPTGASFAIGEDLVLGGGYLDISADGKLPLRGVTLPESCSAYAGRAWFAGRGAAAQTP